MRSSWRRKSPFSCFQEETFTHAGNDFFKKLNTIIKCIREGRWTPPSKITEKEAKKIDENVRQFKIHQRELEGECAHWQYMMTLFGGKNDPEKLKIMQDQRQKALRALEKFNAQLMNNSKLKEVV